MTETPPRFWSKRFREILFPALRGNPLSALLALYWFLTRRRLRGWGHLLIAASEAPFDYRRWISNSEQRAIANFGRCSLPGPKLAGIAVLVVAEDGIGGTEVERTVESVRAALGCDKPIRLIVMSEGVTSFQSALSLFASEHGKPWVFTLLAGDVVSSSLGAVLGHIHDDASSLVYWDEDRLDADGRSDPWIKPGWDPVLFGRLHGLAGASIVSASAAMKAVEQLDRSELSRDKLERILTIAGCARSSGTPLRIPLVLTHRSKANALRREADSSARPASGDLQRHWPSVSVLIPTRDRPDLLAACLRGVERTSYPGSLELILIDNGTRDCDALALLQRFSNDPTTRIIRDDRDFNFSQLNNSAASVANGDFLCFLNNDVECIDEHWLTLMVERALDNDVGAVGAQLLYPSGRIQHAGVAIGLGGAAGHVQKGVHPSDQRFWTWHAVTRRVSAVTAAAMVVRKSSFIEVGGFDESAFPVAFNDVDLCLRLDRAGLQNIYVADARLLHHESESRGDDRSKENASRFAKELRHLQERWQTKDYNDPHYSPLFSRAVERCVLAP